MANHNSMMLLGSRVDLVRDGHDPLMLFPESQDVPVAVLFCNVHMIMLSRSDELLRSAMNSADIVFADGVPVSWLQSKISGETAATVRGYQVMLDLCKQAQEAGHSVGLYGSSEAVLNSLASRLEQWFPGLDIGYIEAPPFMEIGAKETAGRLSEINQSGVKILFVALGCPKQEIWIDQHKRSLDCSLLGVGAAFEWLAGVEPMVPKWMERAGLAWFYRWLHHPVKLFTRYAYYNPRFIVAALLELIKAERR